MYSLCRSLRSKPYVKSAMTASPSRLIIAFTSMCQMWVSKSNCEFRMTFRNWHVLDEEMLLTFRVSSVNVLCALSLFIK